MNANKTAVLCALISGVVAIVVAYITSGAAFERKLAAAQDQVATLQQDLATTSTQAATLRHDLDTLTSQTPKSFRPSPGNCKPVAATPRILGEPNVCGGDYFMTGINHEGTPVCCTIEPVR